MLQIPFLVSYNLTLHLGVGWGGDRGIFLLFKNFYKGKYLFRADNCNWPTITNQIRPCYFYYYYFSQLRATQLTLRIGWKFFSKSEFCWKPPHSFQVPRYPGSWNALDLTDFCKLKGEFLPGMATGGSCQALNPGADASAGWQRVVFIWTEEWWVSPSCSVVNSSGQKWVVQDQSMDQL